MKKTILVNKSLRENINESSIKVGEKDYEKRLRKRIVDLRRALQLTKDAIEKAEKAENSALVKSLTDRAAEIEELLLNCNLDRLNPEELSDPEEIKIAGEDEEDEKNEGDPVDPVKPADPTEIERDDKEGPGGDPIEPGKPEEPGKNKKGPGGDPSEPGEPIEPEKEDDDEDEGGEGYPIPENPEKEKEETKKEKSESGEDEDEGESYPINPDKPEKKEDPETEEKDDSEESEEEEESEENENSEEEEKDPTKKNKKNKPEKKGSSEEENEDETEEEEEESKTKDDPVEDPFADEEDIPDLNQLLGGGAQEPREAEIKDIIKQLKKLPVESKKGAIVALQELISKATPKTESLHTKLTEAIKGVRDMTDDEFGDFLNSTYDLIDQVEKLAYEDEAALKAKKARVSQWSVDPKTLKELGAEDDLELQKDYRKKVAREGESSKYSGSKVGTLEDFKINFYNAIKTQVEMIIQEYQSYNEINAEYESEDVIMKADITQELPEEVIPVIDIYFDVSGSWKPADIEIGKQAIATVKEFEDMGEIKINIFYFSDDVSENYYDVYDGGTSAWRKILQNIKATGAQNVMVMTDNDIEKMGQYAKRGHSYYKQHDAIHGPTCKVDGCVWFLWKNGLASPSCVDHLIGRQGTYQYAFYR